MRTRRFNIPPTRLKIGIMTGGIREDKAQLELDICNLNRGINYQEVDGVFNGYKSIEGYEVYDGRALASATAAPIKEDGTYNDVAREAARAAITKVGGAACTGSVLSLFNYDEDDSVFAARIKIGTPNIDSVWKSTPTGWDETTFTSSLGLDASYKFIKARFDLLAGLQRKPIVIFVSTKSKPHYINPVTNVATEIAHADLPTDSYPSCLADFKNRLWLGYPDGRLCFSNVGDPTDFETTTFSGVIYLEDEIVDLKVTKGDSLVVFCKNSIQVVKALSTADIVDQTVVDYLFSNITLTDEVGAVGDTAQVVLDDLVYVDERGLTSISATQAYGDFETKSYSKGINKTLSLKYSSIIGSFVKKEYNQYRLFFSGGTGLVFTFTLSSRGGSSVKTVKGITTFKYNDSITSVTSGFFGSDDGFVYKIDSGTSFNGDAIESVLETSYYHYSSPTYLKKFREIVLEGIIPYGLSFNLRSSFDYRNISYIDSATVETALVTGSSGAMYGEGIYGSSLFGGAANQTITYPVNSQGTSMSFYISSSSKYSQPHTLSSMIVQYSTNGRKM